MKKLFVFKKFELTVCLPLTENLRQMEEDGLVKREIFAEVPLRVEYSLTLLGWKLRPLIDAFADFGKIYKEEAKKR